MSTQPAVSIVLPVRKDCTSTIIETIRNILRAGLDTEIIVADDASAGDVAGLVRGLNNPAVMCFCNSIRRGRGAAMRLGFAAARRPFIIVHDPALLLDVSAYRAMLEPLAKGRAEMVVEAGDGEAEPRSSYTGYPPIDRAIALVPEVFRRVVRPPASIMAFRRDRLMMLNLSSDGGAAIESEIMARAARARWRIVKATLPNRAATKAISEAPRWCDALGSACARLYFRFMD